MSRLKRIKDQSPTATLFDRQYGYNNASQINQITEPAQVRNFGYDNVDRLTSMTSPTLPSESYSFDDVGNRLTSHRSANYGYEPNQFNRLASTDTANYSYDANGNIRLKAEGKELWRYGWDFENRMTSASTRKRTVRYKYDALGRRIQRFIVGGEENTKFIYDGQDILVDDNQGVLTKYLNGQGIDNKLRMQTGSDVKYFLTDHLGSTNALTDSSGNVTSSASYDSFGNATGNLATRYQFTGREYDSFTGLHYYRARWYDGNLGPNRNNSKVIMSIYNGWIDFVSFPLDPEKCHSQQQRLDTTNAIRSDYKNYTPELGTERGVIVTKNIVLFDDDEFEAIEINKGGGVTIWTKKRVWILQNQVNREKLIFLPRHPNTKLRKKMSKTRTTKSTKKHEKKQ